VSKEVKVAFEFIKKAPSNRSPWNFILGYEIVLILTLTFLLRRLLNEINFDKTVSKEVEDFANECYAKDDKCIAALELLIEIIRAGASTEGKDKAIKVGDVVGLVGLVV
jgi:hypothetical protein